ncbi:hypothetical protein BGZ72_002699 [Mortierella alpina]|nr:hypothetical protein BGZ72_002699 [Mortierella alpina]
MIKDTVIPTFDSTLVIAFPDVLLAGPKILLSSRSASTQDASSIAAWSHYCSAPPSTKKKTASTGHDSKDKITAAKGASLDKVHYSTSTATTGDHQKLGLLTIAVAPPTTEQATQLCEAIVKQAQASGTRRIVLVAASNFAAKEQRTHLVTINQDDSALGLAAAVPKDVPLGDHILNTCLTLLAFTEIPTTAVVHPAKKGTGRTECRTILENLTASLTAVVGNEYGSEFSADAAFQYSVARPEDEESAQSMMYM